MKGKVSFILSSEESFKVKFRFLENFSASIIWILRLKERWFNVPYSTGALKYFCDVTNENSSAAFVQQFENQFSILGANADTDIGNFIHINISGDTHILAMIT